MPTSSKHHRAKKKSPSPDRVLVIDIGGSNIKILATGQIEPRKVPSGTELTPKLMVDSVKKLAKDWKYDGLSIGYPGIVGPNGPRSEPGHLGSGWVGFDFAAAFGLPVRIINDAAMQALGAYEGGRMVFLGLGTGLGSVFIAENVIVPLELGRLPYGKGVRLGDQLSHEGLKRLGKAVWRRILKELVAGVTDGFLADYVTLGGGNAKLVKELPHGTRRGNNLTAFRGGFRLWDIDEVQTLNPGDAPTAIPEPPSEWRVI